jgi:integral membrane sensor domain MASE1
MMREFQAKQRELLVRMNRRMYRVRYIGVVLVLVIWLSGFLADIVGNLIHLLLPVALIMTLFIYFAGRRVEREKL